MESILALVDFDNCRNNRLKSALGGRGATLADYQSVFEEIVSGIVFDATGTTSERREFTFRFYGAWFDAQTGEQTDLHDMLIRCMAGHTRRLRQSRLKFEIAYGPLFQLGIRLGATLRTEPWSRPEGKVDAAAECVLAGAGGRCREIECLNSWLKGRCPNAQCAARLTDVAKRRGQKLVDTLIVADSVSAGASGLYEKVIILSADDDLIPGVIFQNNTDCIFSLARLNYASERGRYDMILNENGVSIHDI